MNRRNLLKSGLAIAGGSLLASNAVAGTIVSEAVAPIAAPGKHKLGNGVPFQTTC